MSTPSDTPRTDAAEQSWLNNGEGDAWTFARSLERENNRLQEALTAANHGDVPAGWDAAIARAERAESENAKLRKALEKLAMEHYSHPDIWPADLVAALNPSP
jgi:hypothetical protein